MVDGAEEAVPVAGYVVGLEPDHAYLIYKVICFHELAMASSADIARRTEGAPSTTAVYRAMISPPVPETALIWSDATADSGTPAARITSMTSAGLMFIGRSGNSTVSPRPKRASSWAVWEL